MYAFPDKVLPVTGFTYTPENPRVSQTGDNFDVTFKTTNILSDSFNSIYVSFPKDVWGSMIQAE
ncbi:MAG: hypothetical protein QF535_05540 [Anaerolineales bacterium]|nr:hypothetical protein [Anaerolineales bacterium]